ncbi:unnamed protein product [Darwinula stevensoni]|uniref:GH18 domain-containing protein n=1 Tax=Darwinula stevensoni TaxID=69355 RepID=A0A7R9AD14_9CRUS|nr:unnamed protein product [Darwinula stevensoni]CAG0900685.1 unnamed protein product [Darwinula stevensoni]
MMVSNALLHLVLIASSLARASAWSKDVRAALDRSRHRADRYGEGLVPHAHRDLWPAETWTENSMPRDRTAYARVCYYVVEVEAWAAEGGLQPEGIDPELCTHLNLGWAVITENLTLEWSGVPPENTVEVLRRIYSLRRENPDLKILLTVGGGGGEFGFPRAAASTENRNAFAGNAARFLLNYGLDGLDLDWEFPAWFHPYEERRNFSLLVQALHRELKAPPYSLLLSVAVAASKTVVDQAYEVAPLSKYVDHVNLMSYGFNAYHWYTPYAAHNAPLYARSVEHAYFATLNTDWAAQYWNHLGMPRSKIFVGIPTYGHTYKLLFEEHHVPGSAVVDSGSGNGSIPYFDVCSLLNASGSHREWDREARVPYAYSGREWISYDDLESIQLK